MGRHRAAAVCKRIPDAFFDVFLLGASAGEKKALQQRVKHARKAADELPQGTAEQKKARVYAQKCAARLEKLAREDAFYTRAAARRELERTM